MSPPSPRWADLLLVVLSIAWLLLGVGWFVRGDTGKGVTWLLLGLAELCLGGLMLWRRRSRYPE